MYFDGRLSFFSLSQVEKCWNTKKSFFLFSFFLSHLFFYFTRLAACSELFLLFRLTCHCKPLRMQLLHTSFANSDVILPLGLTWWSVEIFEFHCFFFFFVIFSFLIRSRDIVSLSRILLSILFISIFILSIFFPHNSRNFWWDSKISEMWVHINCFYFISFCRSLTFFFQYRKILNLILTHQTLKFKQFKLRFFFLCKFLLKLNKLRE